MSAVAEYGESVRVQIADPLTYYHHSRSSLYPSYLTVMFHYPFFFFFNCLLLSRMKKKIKIKRIKTKNKNKMSYGYFYN